MSLLIRQSQSSSRVRPSPSVLRDDRSLSIVSLNMAKEDDPALVADAIVGGCSPIPIQDAATALTP